MNKKLLSVLIIGATLTAGTAAFAANTSGSTSTIDSISGKSTMSSQMRDFGTKKQGMGKEQGKGMKMMNGKECNMMGEKGMGMMGKGEQFLTDAEKTSLATMTLEQKKVFFYSKKAEMEVKKNVRESVIDKLLSGTSLTSEEEIVRQEIITERTKMKAQKVQMDTIKSLIEKQKSGTTLTATEQTQLDSFKASMPQRKSK